MASEATKFRERWKREQLWDQYFKDKKVLDIGCGDDKICESATGWELASDGNGQFLASIPNESYDVVFSSHFLEHVADPLEALLNQWRVLRPSGYLIFQIPDEDLYEQFAYPSIFNGDHKYTWTIHKDHTWSPASKNVIDVLKYLPHHKIISLRTIDTNYNYSKYLSLEPVDQTVTGADASIEVVVQKNPPFLAAQGLLERVFMCPRCQRMEFVIRGVNKEGRMAGWCHGCGCADIEFTR